MQFHNGSMIVGRWQGIPVRMHWTIILGALFFSRFAFAPAFWTAFVFKLGGLNALDDRIIPA